MDGVRAMAGRLDGTDAVLAQLAAEQLELRAELLVTQAALAGALAELARQDPEPNAAMGDTVTRLLGFAGAAASGLAGQPGARPRAVTDAAARIAAWAEGMMDAPHP
jgi:hypothetical protein